MLRIEREMIDAARDVRKRYRRDLFQQLWRLCLQNGTDDNSEQTQKAHRSTSVSERGALRAYRE
jgi:hypothetical protein